MNKYKSLIFREMKISRKVYFSAFITVVAFIALFILSIFVVGKDLNEGESLDVFVLMASYMCSIVTATIFADNSSVFKADIASGWRRYSIALPVTPLENTIARYSVKFIEIIIGMIITIIGSISISAIGGCSFSPAVIFCFFIFLDLFLVFDIIYQSIISRANDMKSLKKLGMIASGIGIAIFTLLEFIPLDSEIEIILESLMKDIEESNSPLVLNKYVEYVTIPNTAGYIGIALTFLILAVGFIITLKNNERREA